LNTQKLENKWMKEGRKLLKEKMNKIAFNRLIPWFFTAVRKVEYGVMIFGCNTIASEI